MKKVKKKPPMKIDGKRDSIRFWAVAIPGIIIAVIELTRFILDYLV